MSYVSSSDRDFHSKKKTPELTAQRIGHDENEKRQPKEDLLGLVESHKVRRRVCAFLLPGHARPGAVNSLTWIETAVASY